MAKTEYGLQMYSVRDVTKDDLHGALKAVAEMGYRYIEFAGFFGNPASDVKAWLDEFGLVCSGTHTGIDLIRPDKIDETIAYHQAIGCKNLIVPGADWSSAEKLDENIALLNEAQKKLAAAGIVLGYHNHSAEFFPTPYGKVIEEEILARTSVELEIDTFWSFNAGIDTIAFLEAHKDRIRVIHLKDGFAAPAAHHNFAECRQGVVGQSVGSGEAPVLAVREWANRNGVLMVIESEGLDPTGLEEVKRCIDYLRSLEA